MYHLKNKVYNIFVKLEKEKKKQIHVHTCTLHRKEILKIVKSNLN